MSKSSHAGTVERSVLSPGRLFLANFHAQIQQQADRTFLDKATPLLTLSHLEKLIHTIKRLIDSKSLKFSPIIISQLVLIVEMIMLHVQNQTNCSILGEDSLDIIKSIIKCIIIK